MSMSTGKVIGRYVTGMFQGKRPIPAQGILIFTPQAEYVLRQGDTTMLPSPVTAVLDSEGYVCSPDISMKTRKPLYAMNGTLRPGTRGVMLTATDDPNSLPKNWTWKVEFKLTSLGDPVNYRSFSFSLPEDSEVDLTKVTPIPGVSGYSTIEGPKGDSVQFQEEQDPHTIENPQNGFVVPYQGSLYGYTDGWVKIGDLTSGGSSAPETSEVSDQGNSLKLTKTSEGLVNMTGVVEGEEFVFGHIDPSYAPEIELSFPIVSCDGSKQEIMTLFPNGSFQAPAGRYSISHTYNPGGH